MESRLGAERASSLGVAAHHEKKTKNGNCWRDDKLTNEEQACINTFCQSVYDVCVCEGAYVTLVGDFLILLWLERILAQGFSHIWTG